MNFLEVGNKAGGEVTSHGTLFHIYDSKLVYKMYS